MDFDELDSSVERWARIFEGQEIALSGRQPLRGTVGLAALALDLLAGADEVRDAAELLGAQGRALLGVRKAVLLVDTPFELELLQPPGILSCLLLSSLNALHPFLGVSQFFERDEP